MEEAVLVIVVLLSIFVVSIAVAIIPPGKIMLVLFLSIVAGLLLQDLFRR